MKQLAKRWTNVPLAHTVSFQREADSFETQMTCEQEAPFAVKQRDLK